MGLAKTFLAIGIAIILAIFIGYGLYVAYEPPKYDYTQQNSCYETYNCNKPQQDCYEQFNYNYSNPSYKTCQSLTNTPEYNACQNNFEECNNEYTKTTASYKYYRNCFFILLVFGLAFVLLGALLTSFEGIGSGLIGGGILIIIWSVVYTWSYWMHVNKVLRLIALGIVLVILMLLGYWKIESRKRLENN